MPGGSVALPAFHLLEKRAAAENALNIDRRLGRNRYGRSGFFVLPARRERLDRSDKVCALLVREGPPRRHIGRIKTTGHGIEQVIIRRKCARGRGAALEDGQREIPRLWIDPLRVLAGSVSRWSVTADAEAPVQNETALSLA